jgi:hypothetical protein
MVPCSKGALHLGWYRPSAASNGPPGDEAQFLQKPFTMDAFVEAVQDILSTRAKQPDAPERPGNLRALLLTG